MFDALWLFRLLFHIPVEVCHILVAVFILVEIHLFPDVVLSKAWLVKGILLDWYFVRIAIGVLAGDFEGFLACS